MQCLFVVFLVALHGIFAGAFCVGAGDKRILRIHTIYNMRKIALISFICCLFSVNLAIGQGCAAVYAKKISINNNVVDTADFTALELNNGIQMQCGEVYMLGAETFAPGGSSNYVYEQIPYEPPFQFNSGTEYILPRDDCWGMVMSLGFNRPPEPAGTPDFRFSFYGNSYTHCVIGSNALLSWDLSVQSQTTACENGCSYSQGQQSGPLPNPARYKNCVYGPYHDIHFLASRPTYPGHMYFQIIGDYPCRKIVLSFYEVPLFGNTSEIATHMMVLYETTNVIEFYMQNKPCCTSTNSGLATLGIHNADGTQAVTITNGTQSYNTTQWTAQNEAWRIKPSGQLETYGVEWTKRKAFDYGAAMEPVASDAQGAVTVNLTAEDGPYRYFCKNTIVREDGEEFEVWDSSAVYYPIDMPDIVVSHNGNVAYVDTVCRGENVNFVLSGGGENGKYYQIAPFANPDDTLTELQTSFTRANNRTLDSVKYVFKIENYDQHGTLVCTRYDSCVVMNRSFNVELREDLTICRNDEVVLTDLLNEHAGTSSWSTGATGDTLTFTPQETGNYILTKTDNLGCTASDTVLITVNDSPEVTISGIMAICAGTSTKLTATSNPANCVFEWSNGSTESSITVNPGTSETYTVSVKLPPAMCETVKTATVEVKPLPTISVSQDKLICEGETADVSVNGDATLYVWESSDPAVNGSNATSFTVSPKSSTLYKVYAYNDINCLSQDEVLVTVEPKPTPIINLNPGVLDALDPTTIITDASRGNVSRTWTLSDGFTSGDEQFVHTFPLTDTTMRFDINLVATSNAGCVDSVSTFIRVKRDHFLWAPTGIYLHDNNPANRAFRLWIDNIVEYELMIFNRNGEMLFKTNNIEKAWDCTHKGETVMQGVYVWKVKYRHNDAPNRLESEQGTFMIYN